MKTRGQSKRGGRGGPPHVGQRAGAFTLVEVMIASGILFMCLFAILALVSNSLQNARLIQNTKDDPTASDAADVSYVYFTTNGQLGPISGEFLGRPYETEITPVTNGLFYVELLLPAHQGRPESRMDFYVYNGKQIQQGMGPGMGRRPRR